MHMVVRADKVFWSSRVCEIAAGGFPVKCGSVLTEEELSCSSLCAFIGAMCTQIFQLWHWHWNFYQMLFDISVIRSHLGSKLGTLSAIKWKSIVCLNSLRHPKLREDIVHAGYDHIRRFGTEEVHHWLTWVGIHSHRGLDVRRPQKLALPDFWVLWHLGNSVMLNSSALVNALLSCFQYWETKLSLWREFGNTLRGLVNKL